MEMNKNYDYEWLEQGMLKRQSNSSNVICFETRDHFRFLQAKAFLTARADGADIYSLNGWSGLCKFKKDDGTPQPVTRGAGGEYDEGIENNILQVRDALLYMDDILKTEKSIFILHDLDANRDEERDRDLVRAVRDWAYNQEICLSESMIVVFCGNISMVLDQVTSEKVVVIRPPLSGNDEREKLIFEQWKKLMRTPKTPKKQQKIKVIAQATAGLNLHQVKTIMIETYYRAGQFAQETIKELKSEVIKRSDLVELEEPDPKGFDSVGGYGVVKKFVRDTVIKPLLPSKKARKIPRGIILFGPPGTGKTIFAKALAKEVLLPFINLKVENLYSQYLGVSGHKFRDAISLIEQMSPAIVFIDEIDKFGSRRGGASDGASEETRRVFNQVLEWLGKKERESIIVGTSNRPGDLDKALRVGRIDYWIPFLYPNKHARKKIIEIHLGESDLPSNVIEWMAASTENFSGAEIEELVNRAYRKAFTDDRDSPGKEDIERALRSFLINKESREREIREYLEMAKEFTNDLEFFQELEADR